MSYTIDKSDQPNNGSITVPDLSVDAESTSITFVGKNWPGYGPAIAENFLHMLENFAKATAPASPIIGQLWYDTNITSDPAQPQLKVWDGISWVPAGNIKKKASAPTSSESIIGDLWADTANQQLYLWSGSNWILIGPQFSEGTLTGPKVEQVYDTSNIAHLIISFYVSNRVMVIISKDEFTPKLAITGFSIIKKGINISTVGDDNVTTTLNKLWGTAEKADALMVSGTVVAAENFLRGNAPSTTNYSLSIRNNLGLIIGSDLATSLTVDSSGATILYNKTEGSSVFVRVNQNGTAKDVISVSGTNVGINKTNPTEALDVVGKISTNDSLIVTGTSNAVDLTSGSIRTAGGASITKSLYVGNNATITGQLNSTNIVPVSDITYNLGSTSSKFKSVYAKESFADTFFGTFSGQVTGSVTGSASKLASATVFSLTGDVSSNSINFNGQQVGGAATFATIITSDLISAKTPLESSASTAELLLNVPSTGLRKITKSNFLANAGVMPVGVVMPFAGTSAPNGFLLCDGSEQPISAYPQLFAVINYTYKAQGLLLGSSTFALPDLRGRFSLGADNMTNGTLVPDKTSPSTYITTISATADRVTDVTADSIGLGNGLEDMMLEITQLPDHKHDLRGTTASGDKGSQYYAIRNTSDAISDVDVVPHTTNGPDSLGNGQYLTNSGGVDSATLGSAINLMNPYLTLNYIIFTGTYN